MKISYTFMEYVTQLTYFPYAEKYMWAYNTCWLQLVMRFRSSELKETKGRQGGWPAVCMLPEWLHLNLKFHSSM